MTRLRPGGMRLARVRNECGLVGIGKASNGLVQQAPVGFWSGPAGTGLVWFGSGLRAGVEWSGKAWCGAGGFIHLRPPFFYCTFIV